MVAVNNDGATSTLTITGLGLADAGAISAQLQIQKIEVLRPQKIHKKQP
jgi:hypothetical protein